MSMISFRRSAVAASVVALLVCGASGAAAAPPDSSIPPAADTSGNSVTTEDGAGEPSGAVQSWTLTPGGSIDGSQAGSRPNLSYQVAPGATIDDTVIVYNFGNIPTKFAVYATDAYNNDDGEFDLLTRDEVPVDVGSWVSLGATSITLDPGKQATIPVSIKVPLDAVPGDHVGGIVAAVTAVADTGNGQLINVERRTGTRIYLQVLGELKPELVVANSELSASYDHAVNSFSGAMDVTLRIENRGNVRIGGVPTIEVAGPFGLGSTTLALPEITPLLPGQDVTITTRVDGVPALFFMNTKVSIEPTTFSGEGDVAVPDAEVGTFAPPITVLLGLLLLLFVTLLVRAIRKRRNPNPPGHDDDLQSAEIALGREPQLR